MPNIVYVHIPFGRFYFKARGVKEDSVPDVTKVELTYVPIKGGIVYSDVNRFFYSPGQALVLPPYDVELSCVELFTVCRLCAWMGESSFRCSLYLSPGSWMFPLCTPHYM